MAFLWAVVLPQVIAEIQSREIRLAVVYRQVCVVCQAIAFHRAVAGFLQMTVKFVLGLVFHQVLPGFLQ